MDSEPTPLRNDQWCNTTVRLHWDGGSKLVGIVHPVTDECEAVALDRVAELNTDGPVFVEWLQADANDDLHPHTLSVVLGGTLWDISERFYPPTTKETNNGISQ